MLEIHSLASFRLQYDVYIGHGAAWLVAPSRDESIQRAHHFFCFQHLIFRDVEPSL
jgi:hypothetical protein